MKAETKALLGNDVMSVDLRVFIDRVVVPALLDRFLREQASYPSAPKPELPKIKRRA